MRSDPDLLASFLDEARAHLVAIRKLLAPAHAGRPIPRRDLETLSAHVHNLKGVCGLMGFSYLHALIGHLQRAFEQVARKHVGRDGRDFTETTSATGDEDPALIAPELATAAVTSLERMIDNIERGEAEANEESLLDFEVGAEIFLATTPPAAPGSAPEPPVEALAEALHEEVSELCSTLQGDLFAALDASRPAERQRAAARSETLLANLPATAAMAGRGDLGRLATAFLDLLGELVTGRQPATTAAVDLSLRFTACLERLARAGGEASPAAGAAHALIDEAEASSARYGAETDPIGEPGADDTPLQAQLGAEAARELEAIFLEEATGHLQTARDTLEALGSGSSDARALDRLFRAIHTLKGAAGTAGHHDLLDVAHELEDRLEKLRDARGIPDTGSLDALGQGLTELERRFEALAGEPRPATTDLGDRPDAHGLDPSPSPNPEARSTEQPSSPSRDRTLRVRATEVDRLLMQGGELLAARTRLANASAALREITLRLTRQRRALGSRVDDYVVSRPVTLGTKPGNARGSLPREGEPSEVDAEIYDEADILARDLGAIDHALGESVSQILALAHSIEGDLGEVGRLAASTQDGLTHLRFIPMEELLRRFVRPIQAWAVEEHKEVKVEIDGGDAEIDRAVAEALADPLLHLTRNAIAHGIEAPAEREAAGKAPQGTLRIIARSEGRTVLLEVSDDGRGLDPTRLREAAIARGLISRTQAASLGDAQAADLIFAPGFSTRERADPLAGRGVGLDAVAHRVASLGGLISVVPDQEVGTCFSLRVPASVAILPVLEVEIAQHRLALPLAAVRETMLVDRRELERTPRLRWGGQALPSVDARKILGAPTSPPDAPRRRPVVIVGHGDRNAAVVVDRLVGRAEGLLHPLGPILGALPLYSSAVVAGDGHLLLVLDVSSLLAASIGARLLPHTASRDPEPVSPQILVVDDSLSVRTHLDQTLRSAGYRVRTAVDGADALASARRERPDLLLTDLEMPVLHGFELINALRHDPELADLPVLVITSRVSERHRRQSETLGALEVLGKPVARARLLEAVASALCTPTDSHSRSR